MAKIYSKDASEISKKLPKKDTIRFLLNYSKALRIVKIGNQSFEILAN